MARPLLFYGIDGTGDADDNKYEIAFRTSFVKTLHNRVLTHLRYYHRGPTITGKETEGYAATANDIVAKMQSLFEQRSTRNWCARSPWIAPQRVGSPQPEPEQKLRVCLAGYSRGAAAAVIVAQMLKERGIMVDYLILFDAVDRALNFRFTGRIENNVRRAWHAMRSDSAASREIFGNAATGWDKDNTFLSSRRFHATHGGIGGTPWCTDPKYAPLFAGGWNSPAWDQPINEAKLMSIETTLAAPVIAATGVGGIAQRAAFQLSHALPGMAGVNLALSAKAYATTNVTFREDLQGAREVWDWISRYLRAEGLIQDISCPLDGIENSLNAFLSGA